jgi:hypothetical protein
MKFFEEKYIKSLLEKEKSNTLPKLNRAAFRLATLPDWQELRDSIDNLYSKLPPDSQKKLGKKRNDLQNIWQSVNEIKVGNYLLECGYPIEHEKKFDNLTPDWFVGGNNSFFVEVFTRTSSDREKLENEYFADLKALSKQNTTTGACVLVKSKKDDKNFIWSDELVQDLVISLEKWLKPRPVQHDILTAHGVEFELLAYSEKFSYVYYAIGSDAFFVDPTPIKNSLMSKVEKYKGICNKYKCPLVIACLPDFATAIDREDLEGCCRDLFEKYPNLSAVWGFIDKEVVVLENPYALFPIILVS